MWQNFSIFSLLPLPTLPFWRRQKLFVLKIFCFCYLHNDICMSLCHLSKSLQLRQSFPCFSKNRSLRQVRSQPNQIFVDFFRTQFIKLGDKDVCRKMNVCDEKHYGELKKSENLARSIVSAFCSTMKLYVWRKEDFLRIWELFWLCALENLCMSTISTVSS